MADVEAAAKAMLLRARQQADQLLAAAQTEGEALKAEAKAEGFQQGKSEGLARGMDEGRKAGEQQALAQHTTELQQAIAALTAAATTLDNSRGDIEADGLREVVKLAIAIARRVTKRQALLEPEVMIANLEEAMKLVVQQIDLRIVINPAQRAMLDSALPQLRLQWPSLKHVEVMEDPAISPGGCRIATRQGSIDADLDVQLDRVVADLLPLPTEASR